MSTITFPLKLFRVTAAQLKIQVEAEIAELSKLASRRPDQITTFALNIERLRGQADVLEYLEKDFQNTVAWGVKQNWTMQQVLLAQYDIVAGLATQHPDDTGGSRLNDGKRAYNDGRREVLQYVARELRRSKYFPGN